MVLKTSEFTIFKVDIMQLSLIASLVFVAVTFFILVLDQTLVFAEYSVLSISYTFSNAGMFAVLATYSWGLHVSFKLDEKTNSTKKRGIKHVIFALGILGYTVLAYLTGYTMWMILETRIL